jgi:hypothetical protein
MAEHFVLGLYIPIVIFSGYAVWLILKHLILPSVYEGSFRLTLYAIAISALLSLAAHAVENTLYGLVRWSNKFDFLNDWWGIVGFGKILILASSIYAVVALRPKPINGAELFKLSVYALVLWAVGSVAAALYK